MSSDALENKLLFQPWWLFVAVSLPQLILVGMMYHAYTLVQSLLSPSAKNLWGQYTALFAIVWVSVTGYAAFMTLRKKTLPPWVSIVLFLVYVPFLYAYYNDFSNLFPSNLPFWMLNIEELFVQPNAFIIPGLLYALMVLVRWFTPQGSDLKSWKQFAYATAIPVVWYVFLNLLMPGSRSHVFVRHFMSMVMIITTILFLFFVWRGIVLWMAKAQAWKPSAAVVFQAVVVLVFPLLGLLIYNGVLFGNGSPVKIFGSLSHPWFYALALLNGVLLLLRNPEHPQGQWLLFLGQMALLPFSLYFMVVFLPYLPLSVVAIVAFGLGFLMLTPLAVTAFHFRALWTSAQPLLQRVGKVPVLASGMVAFLVIPGTIFFSLQQERATLHKALSYVYEHKSIRKEHVDVSPSRLRRSLEVLVSQQRRRRRWAFSQNHNIPYLSSLYKWWVLDNLSVSWEKVSTLAHLFLDKHRTSGFGTRLAYASRSVRQRSLLEQVMMHSPAWSKEPGFVMPRTTVQVDKIKTQTAWDSQAKAYRTSVDLSLFNPRKRGNQEYVTYLHLPDGVWLDSYYLFVGTKKVPGILVEKKSALWVYRQVTSRQRDPGLLAHVHGNWWELRVFPFASKETRRTGWTLLHKEPTRIQLGMRTLNLAPLQKKPGSPKAVEIGNSLYVSSAALITLPKVKRKPYFHFLVDMSANQLEQRDRYIQQIKMMREKFSDKWDKSKISLFNYNMETHPVENSWQRRIKEFPMRGGCFLERALQSELVKQYQTGRGRYPIFVVLSGRFASCKFSKDLTHLRFLLPESNRLWVLDANSMLRPFRWVHVNRSVVSSRFDSVPQQGHVAIGQGQKEEYQLAILKRFPFETPRVSAWPNAENPKVYLRASQASQIVPLPKAKPDVLSTKQPASKWERGVALYGAWLAYEMGLDHVSWLGLIKQSWNHQILTPLTSFIVLENEAQYEALRRKQAAVLKGKSYMSASDTATRMSEPGILWLLWMGLVLLWVRKRRNHRLMGSFTG